MSKLSTAFNIINFLLLIWLVLVVNEIRSNVNWLQINEAISIQNRGGR